MNKNSILIIDEAHNIDEVCLDSLTIKIDNYMLNLAFNNFE